MNVINRPSKLTKEDFPPNRPDLVVCRIETHLTPRGWEKRYRYWKEEPKGRFVEVTL